MSKRQAIAGAFLTCLGLAGALTLRECSAVCRDDSGAEWPCRWGECGTCGGKGCICPNGQPPKARQE